MRRREFLKALVGGSVAAVIGEAPRALTSPAWPIHGALRVRPFFTGGIVTRAAMEAWQVRKALRISKAIIDAAPRVVESIARKQAVEVRIVLAAKLKLDVDLIRAEAPPWLERGRVVARWKG